MILKMVIFLASILTISFNLEAGPEDGPSRNSSGVYCKSESLRSISGQEDSQKQVESHQRLENLEAQVELLREQNQELFQMLGAVGEALRLVMDSHKGADSKEYQDLEPMLKKVGYQLYSIQESENLEQVLKLGEQYPEGEELR